ncbi:MAG: accessory factor UbiK family protein [Amphritea sp.]
MINHKLLEGLSAQISQFIETAKDASVAGELQGQLQVLLQGAFNRMDLVTRDEFDAQAAVLARTRSKLEQLQQQLDAIEDTLDQPVK